jgi:hypothetical protein
MRILLLVAMIWHNLEMAHKALALTKSVTAVAKLCLGL